MYYNKSTFPIFLYPMKKSRFSFNKIYQNLTFLTNKENFDIEFLESIKSKEKQDLIGFLMACLPSIIITNFRKFSREELRIQNTIDDSLYELCNLRIDFKSVNEKLVELESNNLVIKCRSTLIISELCHFVFQYIFIQLSKSIYATEFKNKKFLFDIKTNSLLHKKFSDNLPISIDKLIVQDNFINGYIESCKDFLKNRLIERGFKPSISYTTRPKRINESEGIDYFFINEKTFLKKIGFGEFREFDVFNKWYCFSCA